MHEFSRFSNKLDKTGNCWLWKGATYRGGYGHFRRKVGGVWVMYRAHRFAYETFKGEIPEGLLVLHTCDNPSCCNPNHLFLGTHKENTQDMISKGRRGLPRNPKHNHLSVEIAEQVRSMRGMKQKEIAALVGTSVPQVCRILNNKIWA